MTTLSCPAKVNPFLAIRDRDKSGYHEIETILVRTAKLEDLIHIEPAEKFSFECPNLPDLSVEKNSVVRALHLLEQEAARKFKYSILLEKNIPPKSGLGGAASNAAAIMIYLNEHEGLNLSHERLMELATKIGMDVPFFISGHPVALATHYGEKISPLRDLPENLTFEILLTGNEVSTETAYADWDKRGEKSTADSSQIRKAIEAQDAEGVISNLHNDFDLIFSGFSQPSYGLILAGSGGSLVSFHAT